MEVKPREGAGTETWAYEGERFCAVAVRTELVPRLGEDGPPTVLHHMDGRGLIAVYDGAGGAGAATAGETADGRTVTGAFLASRQVHFAVEDWFCAGRVRRDPLDEAPDLDGRLRTALEAIRPPRKRKIRGLMVRELPTTMAAIEYGRAGRDKLNIVARWAGDSRCYRLIAEEGLQLLSNDDTGLVGDESRSADQPMTNMISVDRDFRVNSAPLCNTRLPTVLICATDGFYGYVSSPAHLEHVLLETLQIAEHAEEWARLLAERVRGYTKDDASLALVALGFRSYEELRRSFRSRFRELSERYLTSPDLVLDDEALRRYLSTYETYVPRQEAP